MIFWSIKFTTTYLEGEREGKGGFKDEDVHT
jgi:hypothetical protein